MKSTVKSEIRRINGYLKEVVTLFDESGKQISHVINPIMVELKPRDIMQIMVGSFLIGSPLCFTEEVWVLSENLNVGKVETLALVSVATVTLFIYLNFYKNRLKSHFFEFVKRVLATYFISLFTVALILYLIDKLPWEDDPILSFKRTVIIGFPAVLGATLSDYIK